MSHAITITKLMDGPRNAVFHVYIKGDGVSEDITDGVLVDPTQSFDPSQKSIPSITVEKILYNLVGFDAKLEFDYLVSDTPLWALSGGQENKVCFKDWGGLKDRSAIDGSGKLMVSTSGLIDGFGTMLIHVRKD